LSLAVGYTAPEVWEATLAQLQLRITRQNFESWLRDTTGLRYEGTTLIVGTPTQLAHDWLSARMKPAILQALTAVAGPGLQVQFEVTGASQTEAPLEGRPLQPSMIPALPTPLNPRFTFATFLTGDYNRLALAAALDVCANAESPYSPLFITGPGGCGKTHLLHAIAQQACKQGQRVLLVPADKFLSEFTGAVKNRTGPAFRARYRDLDILLVDDVHFLAGKKATQAEFFQTVAALHDLGRRVVLGGDLQALSAAAGARFASQLRWGLVAEIGQPTIDERVRFLCAKSACQGVSLPEEVVHYIGLRVRSGPRDLEGAINRVLALARISDCPVDIEFAARALQPVSETPLASRPDLQPSAVIEAVCHHLNVERREVCGAKRTREASYARHISMYLLRQDAGLTYAAIAQLLGKKDHSSVVHACRQLQKQLEVSRPLKADIDAIRSALNLPTAAA
jgi:chromosomal replication initiator protein